MLEDELYQGSSAKMHCHFPGALLVDEHERRVQHQPRIHPKIERHLQRLDGVVSTVWISRVVRLANTGDDVFEAAAVGESASEGEEE